MSFIAQVSEKARANPAEASQKTLQVLEYGAIALVALRTWPGLRPLASAAGFARSSIIIYQCSQDVKAYFADRKVDSLSAGMELSCGLLLPMAIAGHWLELSHARQFGWAVGALCVAKGGIDLWQTDKMRALNEFSTDFTQDSPLEAILPESVKALTGLTTGLVGLWLIATDE